MVYAGITVLTPSFMCISTLCKRIYQVYTHLYAKVIDIILAPQEQPSVQRTYKKSAHIGKHLYKLRASHNKLRNECTSGRNSRVKSTRPRSPVISRTRKPRRFRDARNRWKSKNQVGDWRWWRLPPEYHRNNPKFTSNHEMKASVPSDHVNEDVETIEGIDLCRSSITASRKYVDRFYPTIPTDCVIGSRQYLLGHTIANVNESCDVEGGWHIVGFQGKPRKKSSNTDTSNSSKLGVTSNAKLKPKKTRKKKKKKKESTVKSEEISTVKKEQRTFKKVINFIKSLGKSTSN